MTTQTIYEDLNEIKAYFDAGRTKEANILLLEVLNYLQDDINREAAKKAGGATVYKVLKKLLADAGKNRPILGKALRTADNKLIITDGYTAYRLASSAALECLPIHDEATAATYPKGIAQCIDGSAENLIEVDIPTAGEVRAYISEQKGIAKYKGEKLQNIRYKLSNGTDLEASRLLGVLEVLQPKTAKASQYRAAAPVYFSSDKGEAIVCPLRPQEG